MSREDGWRNMPGATFCDCLFGVGALTSSAGSTSTTVASLAMISLLRRGSDLDQSRSSAFGTRTAEGRSRAQKRASTWADRRN
jgi:hypothetical protein